MQLSGVNHNFIIVKFDGPPCVCLDAQQEYQISLKDRHDLQLPFEIRPGQIS